MRAFASSNMPNCIYCGVYQHSQANIKRHVKLSPRCHEAFIEQISEFNSINAANEDSNEDATSEFDPENDASQYPHLLQDEEEITVEDQHVSPSMGTGEHDRQPYIEDAVDKDDETSARCWNQGVEDIRYVKSYLDPAGVLIDPRPGPTKFEKILESEGDSGPWGEFESEGEWELAKWLLQNVGHNQLLKFLNLPIVHCFFQYWCLIC
jgi:hypothetical protein